MNNGSKLEIVLAGQAVAAFRDERDLMETAPARIAEWDALAKRHAADAARLALAIGGTLLAVREKLPHGAFMAWVATNCGSVTVRTAQNYMRLAAARAAADQLEGGGDAEGAEAAKAEQDFGQTLTKLYIDYGVLKPRKKWGGDRSEKAAANGHTVGRPAKGAAAEVAEAAKDPDLNWAEVSDYLRGIREFAVEEDGFGTLADDDLESAVVILTEAAERARALLAARRENGGSAEAVSRIRAELAPDVPCVRADKDGYCTGPCEGSICARCAEYRPVERGL